MSFFVNLDSDLTMFPFLPCRWGVDIRKILTEPRGMNVNIPEDRVIELCARAGHEINRVYCLAHGDRSQPSWEDAPDWQKSSAILGVRGAIAGNTSEQSHQGWLAEKERTGWKYGPVKDAEKKEHPCLVPYAELPEFQRRKDDLYLATVRAMHAALTA